MFSSRHHARIKMGHFNFSYSVNFKYEAMLSHSFERFYVVTKFELPKAEDLHLTTVQFYSTCSYLKVEKDKDNIASSYLPNLLAYYEKIVPYINFYKKQIAYYSCTAYVMLKNQIGLIMPTFTKEKRHKRNIIGSIISGVIGLAYEVISSFLHHKHQKALQKVVNVMEKRTNVQHNKTHHLEGSMIMYGIYNSDILEKLTETVHRMHNTSSWHGKTFVEKLNHWFEWYLHKDGVGHYTINSILFLTTIRKKYVRMYERFIEQLKMYAKVIRILSKGYLPIHYNLHQNYMEY